MMVMNGNFWGFDDVSCVYSIQYGKFSGSMWMVYLIWSTKRDFCGSIMVTLRCHQRWLAGKPREVPKWENHRSKWGNFQAACKKMTPGGYLAIQDMDLIKSRNGIWSEGFQWTKEWIWSTKERELIFFYQPNRWEFINHGGFANHI